MKKITLAAAGTHTILASDEVLHIALITGELSYSTTTPVPADAPILNENLRTDSFASQSQNIYVKAGAEGAVFQYRRE